MSHQEMVEGTVKLLGKATEELAGEDLHRTR
jgi:hypothetical protein